MGTLTKMERSPVDVPRLQTYYAGKGTLTRVGMSAPGGRRPATPLPEKNTTSSVTENKQSGVQQTAWNDAPSTADLSALDFTENALKEAEQKKQSTANAVNDYISANMGQLDLKDPAELEALRKAAADAEAEWERLAVEYNSMPGSYERQFGHLSDFDKAAASVIAKPFLAVDVAVQTAKNAAGDNNVDMNTLAMQRQGQMVQARSDITKDMGKVGTLLTNTAFGIADNLYGQMLTLGIPGVNLASKGFRAASMASMGLSAAADKMYELGGQGESATRSLVRGAVSGGIEALTEKLPLETVANMIKTGGKGLLKNLLKQSGVEATEEGVSYVLNYVADKLAKDPNAAWSWSELFDSVAGGGLSGLTFGLGGTAVHRVRSGTVPGSGLDGTPSVQDGVISNESRTPTQTTPSVAPKTGAMPGTDASGQVRAVEGEKTAPAEAGAEYRAEKPQNVELPTVPIINLSMQDVANMNGGELPQTGNYLRKTVTEQTEKRLGLDKNPAVYIEASNVTRNGDAYVIKITKQSLKKMLSASSYVSGVVPLESVAVLSQIERIAQNGVHFKSEADRQGRSQIAGYDHLMTTVYIDNTPYLVDMRVRVADQKTGNGNTLYHFTPETIEVTKKEDSNISTTGRHAPSIKSETPLSSNTNVPQRVPGVKKQSMQNGPAVFADSSLNQRLAEAETEYNAAIEQAEAGGEYQLAEALYKEKLRLQDALTEQEIGRLKNELEQYQLRQQAREARQSKGVMSEKITPDARNRVKAIRASSSVFDVKLLSDLNRARSWFVEYAKTHFPATVTNKQTGKQIGISRKGIDKFLSGRIGKEKFASGFYIPELIENAVRADGANNYHVEQAESIPTYEYYDSPLEIDGNQYTAHIRVRNTAMGDKYYGHTISEVDNIEIEPSARTSAPETRWYSP